MPSPNPPMTAQDIRDLLDVRHSKDLVVHEAPIGPAGCGQIDTWVMRKSWTQASVIAYEIKVARTDFLNDQKWMKYLPCCNEFYFAVAPGVCDPREIPEGAGLLVAATTGTRLFTKIKAPRKTENVEGIEDVMRSVLMNRTDIHRSRVSGPKDTRERRMARWRCVLDDRAKLGWKVSQAIQSEWDRLKDEARRANSAAARFDAFRKTLIDNGFDPDASEWTFKSDVRKRLGVEAYHVIEAAIDNLTRIRDRLPKEKA